VIGIVIFLLRQHMDRLQQEAERAYPDS